MTIKIKNEKFNILEWLKRIEEKNRKRSEKRKNTDLLDPRHQVHLLHQAHLHPQAQILKMQNKNESERRKRKREGEIYENKIKQFTMEK